MAKISEDNEMEKDNIEAIFLECDENIIDKIVPKKELENFEIDIKEIMKSGCNRQIAEYSLMQYKNNTSKNEYSKYEKAKEELINEINTKLGNKIEAIINTENKDLVEKEIDYEEIIDEILEKNEKNISENNDRYQVKIGLIKLINESKDINLKAFLISKTLSLVFKSSLISFIILSKSLDPPNSPYILFVSSFSLFFLSIILSKLFLLLKVSIKFLLVLTNFISSHICFCRSIIISFFV